jgi:hypothetical protein
VYQVRTKPTVRRETEIGVNFIKKEDMLFNILGKDGLGESKLHEDSIFLAVWYQVRVESPYKLPYM